MKTDYFDQITFLRGYSRPEYLASGSSGVVYRVEKGGKKYALKVVDCGCDPEKIRSMEYEIFLMHRLRGSRNTLQLIDSEILHKDGHTVVFLLESFATSFEAYYKSNAMTIADVLQLGIDICDALDYCWDAGVAHLDVQPKNLFVDSDGRFLLGDFGAGVPLELLNSDCHLRGTLSYMAPEVYAALEYSQASDIYALGMVLYCLLNQGNLPFMEQGSKETAVMTRLKNKIPVPPLLHNPALDVLLQTALAIDVRQRYQSFWAMRSALMETRAQLSPQLLQSRVKAAPAEQSTSVPPTAARRGLLSGLLSFKKKGTPPEKTVGSRPGNTGTLFEPDCPAGAETPVRHVPAGWKKPDEYGSCPAAGGGTLFDADSYACTAPLEPPAGSLFDSDTFATTCIPFSPAPDNLFDADSYAVSVPLTVPCPGNLFDSDSFANTCAMAAPIPEINPLGSSAVPGYGTCPSAIPLTEHGKPSRAPAFDSGILFDADPYACTAPLGSPAGTLFDSDSFANTCAMAAPIPDGQQPGYSAMPGYGASSSAAPQMCQVQFSAVAPKEARKEDYAIIQLFMYEEAFRAVVEEAMAMADAPVQVKHSGFQKVREYTRVKVVLTCPDMPIEDNMQEQIWYGRYLQFDFAICPPETFRKRQILLTATVYFDDVPATRLMLTVKALASFEEEVALARQDIVTAFVSYASQDRTRVGALVQGMRKARPDMDIFFDVTTLRSGEDWEKTLYQEILRRDILFLCWSRNAQASDWVEREWRYALEHKGMEAIEPIPLEQPDICPPPRELWSKHFNDSLLYIINR